MSMKWRRKNVCSKECKWTLLICAPICIHCAVLWANKEFDPLPTPAWPLLEENLNYRNIVSKTQKHFLNGIYGLESLASQNGSNFVYASSKNGQIVKLLIAENFKPVVIDLFNYGSQKIKKRPLGLRFSPFSPELLYFVDAYQGIFVLDTVKKTTSAIYTNESMPYLNDFDFLWNGDLVLSQPSVKYSDEMFHRIVFESRPNGQILRFSEKNKTFEVLLDQLFTPNGIQATPDRRSFYFSEMMAYRIQKVDFADNGVETKVVVDNLPGMPDNIRLSINEQLLIIPLPEERLELPLNHPIMKHHVLFASFIFIQKMTKYLDL
uniref:Strictosidine synthase conserved region domain-containing protein n=1 Tax=Panagrolaimus sp. JU765 TaxID=591449 RepID=A0AC34Q5F3_9BILA